MIIAIDPGKSGAIVSHNNRTTLAWSMPQTREDAIRLFKTLEGLSTGGDRQMIIEQQHGAGSTRSSPTTMFTFGCYYERMIMVALMCGFAVTLVTPQRWMKVLNLGTIGTRRAPNGSSDAVKKEFKKSNQELKRLWKLHLRDTARKIHPEMAGKITLDNCDAILILAYAQKVTQ